MKLPRKVYHVFKSFRLKNKTPTILTNNCVGGMIYHDLGVRFFSPTINLWMRDDDYLTFLEQLQEFLSADVEEVQETGIQYPVGCLSGPNGAQVRLYFMHYSSFQMARKKWNERKRRINLDNLYAIMEYPGFDVPEARFFETVKRFDSLPIQNKRLLTGHLTDSPNAVVMDVLSEERFLPGKILRYKTRCSVKRFLDDFDYIRFLNTK